MSLFSNNFFDYEKLYDKAKIEQRTTGIFNFDSPIKKYNDNIIGYTAFENPDNELLNNSELINNSNYNGNTLEENRMIEQAYSLQKELTINDMMNILTTLKNKWDNFEIKSQIPDLKQEKKNNDLSRFISYHFLFQLNEYLLENSLSSDKHKFSFFKIDKIFYLNNNKNNNGTENDFTSVAIRISRPDKIYNFTIEIDYKLNENKVNYINIKLIGINSDYIFTEYKKELAARDNAPVNNFNISDFVGNNTESVNNMLKEYEEINKKINFNYNLFSKDPVYHLNYSENVMLYPENGCFILDKNNYIKELEVQNPVRCKSYWEEYDFNGVWDTKCQSDSECPYYDDKRKVGGCDEKSGVCEFPVGATRIGYKKVLKGSKPKCADCPIADPYCCYSKEKKEFKFIN